MAGSLYARLGGYDAIWAVADNLLPRLMNDDKLGRFWQHRSDDGIRREKQLLVDFLSSQAGGPVYYTGRDMLTSHRGMRISETDWQCFIGHLSDTLAHFDVGDVERSDVLVFVESTKAEIVET
jgi:hemoglobin